MKYVVARLEEIPPGSRKIVEVGHRSIGVFNLGGEFFALRNICPHQGAPLCTGKIWGTVRADSPGDIDYQPGAEIITCPHHGWEFHIRTGKSWCDPDRLRTGGYRVEVTKGSELVAETIEVSVEDHYVVLDLA